MHSRIRCMFEDASRHRSRAAACVAASLVVCAMAAPVCAEPGTNAGGSSGNISGIWLGYPNFIEALNHPDPKITPPPAGDPPLKPKYAAAYAAQRVAERESDLKGEAIATVGTDCLPYGMPQMMEANYPMEVLQTPGQVTIIAEAFTQVRRIFIGKPQLDLAEVPPGYYGRSVGHWEGDTLVAQTIGVKDSVLGHKRMPHSAQMRITERLRLVAPDVLNDQITVEDPVYLEKPWTFTFAYKRKPRDYEMTEYVCDNNHEYVDDKGVTHFRMENAKAP